MSSDGEAGQDKGLVYVFTGEGKGKTSAAIGVAVRAAGAGMRVSWVAWYKQKEWGLSELSSLERVGVAVTMLGKGFHLRRETAKVRERGKIKVAPVGKQGGVVVDTATEQEHEAAAQAAMRTAVGLMGKCDVLILDEINNAVHDGLVTLGEVKRLIEQRGRTHLILTGRDAHEEVVVLADLVTEMKKVKHPYDKGKLAVKGLDF